MKRLWMTVLALTAAAGVAGAQDLPAADPQDELTAALQDISAVPLGTLTVADMTKVAARISVARQKQAYVRRAALASMIFPGAGQLMTGDTLGGVLFLTGDLAIMTGAALGAYFLLPADLRFGRMDYAMAPMSGIKAAWLDHSVMDFLPSFGVMAGGMLLKGILGHVSSRLAAEEARRNVSSGAIRFSPTFDFMGTGFMMGMRMRM